ncbi:hypothetical protein [Streptomyces sp. NPDC059371]|uniref:hypothetical protein n=1 Tax=Streptomyces sp. NPDC059371 TaxID=3346812 RepID=UPI00369FA70B
MHPTRRLLTMAVAAAVAAFATALSAAPPTAAASCTSTWRAVQEVTVRRPAWNEGLDATTRSPVVRYLRRGERVRSCIVAVDRNSWSQYRECGGGSLCRVVSEGQVPPGCLRPGMSQQADPVHRDHDQALALTLAVLLLTGASLLVSCWIGPVATFTAAAVLAVTAYAVPGLARRLAIRRAVRRLSSPLPALDQCFGLFQHDLATGSMAM